jgi:hypothetical protein
MARIGGVNMYILRADGSTRTYTDDNDVTIKMEYRYLEYVNGGYVITIYNDMPLTIKEGCKIAISNNINFEEGYELINDIVVQEVDELGNVLSCYKAEMQNDAIKFLRQERDILKEQVTELSIALANIMGI